MGVNMGRAMMKAGEFLRYAGRGMVDLIWPDVCLACSRADAEEGGLCEPCGRTLLSHVSLPYCPRCGATLGPNILPRLDGCGSCPTALPRFDRVVRLGPYAAPLRTIVRELKYHRRVELCGRMGGLLAQAVTAACDDGPPDVILPVPMHWRRRLARGHDHSRVLARAIARPLKLPIGDELIRVRHTPAQVGLTRAQRQENIRGAFGVVRAETLGGAHVLLVDDVTTTGATADEAAAMLAKAGARRVSLAVIAKSEPPAAYAEYWGR
ncbi:MAG: ComF family protein [Planctomycetota bacterium]|nr:ComF family protein [Planctomycetota bacterium]